MAEFFGGEFFGRISGRIFGRNNLGGILCFYLFFKILFFVKILFLVKILSKVTGRILDPYKCNSKYIALKKQDP